MVENLYIKNYSNTEFIEEEYVYEYLEKLRNLITDYNKIDYSSEERIFHFDDNNYLKKWQNYVGELINELFNSFVLGQFICSSAMTRSLIEACAYLTILINEEDGCLITKSFQSSVMGTYNLINESEEYLEKFNEIVKKYCEETEYDHDEFMGMYHRKNENVWLNELLNKKRVTFSDVCEYISLKYLGYYNYIDTADLYYDFRNSSNYVHAQSFHTKGARFVFYETIFSRLFDMSRYIFETITLFPISDDFLERVNSLYNDLLELSCRINKIEI